MHFYAFILFALQYKWRFRIYFLRKCVSLLSKNMAYATCLLMGGLVATPAWSADCVSGVNTANCSVPAGSSSVVIEVWGGGGGSGGGDIGIDGGGGGGGGAYCKGSFSLAAAQS